MKIARLAATLILLLCGTPLLQALTVSGSGIQNGYSGVGLKGTACFGATCITLTGGSFSGTTVSAGTYTFTAKDPSGNTVLTILNVVVPAGGLVVSPSAYQIAATTPNAPNASGIGAPYWACASGAQYTRTNPENPLFALWTCGSSGQSSRWYASSSDPSVQTEAGNRPASVNFVNAQVIAASPIQAVQGNGTPAAPSGGAVNIQGTGVTVSGNTITLPTSSGSVNSSTVGTAALYSAGTAVTGVDPLLGRYGNGTLGNPSPPLDATPRIPVSTNLLPVTGNSAVVMAGNSIPAGVGATQCSTGTNTALSGAGTCFFDQLANLMAIPTHKNNISVGGDFTCDTIGHALNDAFGLPSVLSHSPYLFMNMLNEADVKDRGAYEADSRGCMNALIALWSSDTSTRVRGNDVTPATNWSLDTTYTNWSGLQTSTNAAVQTIPFTLPTGGFLVYLNILFPVFDLPGTTTQPGHISVSLDGGTAIFISNGSPVPVLTQNGATTAVMSYRYPATLSPGAHTLTVTSLLSGSQNYAGITGITWTSMPSAITTCSVIASVPTFVASNTALPVVGQRLIGRDFTQCTFANQQILTVASVNVGAKSFTTNLPAGGPPTLSSQTENSGAVLAWAEPAMWMSGSSRNLRAPAENDRAVNTYDNLTKDVVREWRGDGAWAQVNYWNTQTAWLNNESDMSPGNGSHHPTATLGESELLSSLLAPTYEPEVAPPARKTLVRTTRLITSATVGGCTISPTDDIVVVFDASPITCILPDEMSSIISAQNNQAIEVKIINTGSGVVTVNQDNGDNWSDTGIQLATSQFVSVASTNPTSTAPGRWYTTGKTVPIPNSCTIQPGLTFTLPNTSTSFCLDASNGSQASPVSLTWGTTTGLTVGATWTIFNPPVTATADVTFTNFTVSVYDHIKPGCSITYVAITTAAVKNFGQACDSMNIDTVPTTVIAGTAYTMLPSDSRLTSTNSSTTTITLNNAWSPGYKIKFKNKGTAFWQFTGASSGTTTTKIVLPGEWGEITSDTSGVWDVNSYGPTTSPASGSIGGSTLAAGACNTGTITMAGVAAGMGLTQPTPSVDIGAGFSLAARVSATGTITIQECNITLGVLTPVAATFTEGVTP